MNDRPVRNSVAVVVPAATCPCEQVERIVPQLTTADQLIVVRNGMRRRDGHNCASRLAMVRRCVDVRCDGSLGPAGARNAGVRAASAEVGIYAFADADDVVTPSWLSELRRPLSEGLADIVGGSLRITSARGRGTVLPDRDYWHKQSLFGGNLALTVAAWRGLGGFDPQFRYCEDTDLAWRADGRFRIEVVPSAVVEVTPRPLGGEVLQRLRWGKASTELLARHDLSLGDHLPSLSQLVDHKRASGYCRRPVIAAVAQWLGQLHRLTHR